MARPRAGLPSLTGAVCAGRQVGLHGAFGQAGRYRALRRGAGDGVRHDHPHRETGMKTVWLSECAMTQFMTAAGFATTRRRLFLVGSCGRIWPDRAGRACQRLAISTAAAVLLNSRFETRVRQIRAKSVRRNLVESDPWPRLRGLPPSVSSPVYVFARVVSRIRGT